MRIPGIVSPPLATRLLPRTSTSACTCRPTLAPPRKILSAGLRGFHVASSRSAAASASTSTSAASHGESQTLPPRPPLPSRARRGRSGAVAAAIVAVGGAAWLLSSSSSEEVLSEQRFVPLKVTAVERVNAETSTFTLALPKSMLSASGPSGPILSLYVMQPDLQIQRPYTVLRSSSFAPEGSEEVELLVKRYETGEMSRWMHRLRIGDEVRVRGPVVSWDYREGSLDEVVFIVGGTGVTPAYQLLEHVLAQPSAPKVSIIYASPSPSTILLKTPLDAFVKEHPDKVSIKYLVDRLDPGTKAGGLHVGMVNRKVVEQVIGRGGVAPRRMVVVCGPEGLVSHVAGPRARDLSQGPVGGILGELGYTSREVVKL